MKRTLTSALALCTALALLPSCSGDDDDTGANVAEGRWTAELTGAEEADWSGEATYDRNNFVNATTRWTISMETGDPGDPTLVINLLNANDPPRDMPATGIYGLGQFGPNSSAEGVLFGEFYMVGSRDYT